MKTKLRRSSGGGAGGNGSVRGVAARAPSSLAPLVAPRHARMRLQRAPQRRLGVHRHRVRLVQDEQLVGRRRVPRRGRPDGGRRKRPNLVPHDADAALVRRVELHDPRLDEVGAGGGGGGVGLVGRGDARAAVLLSASLRPAPIQLARDCQRGGRLAGAGRAVEEEVRELETGGGRSLRGAPAIARAANPPILPLSRCLSPARGAGS